MAKINIEMELSWLEEGECLDEILKEEIINSVSSRLTSAAELQMQKKVNAMVDEKLNHVDNILDDKINEIMTDFLETPRTITDQWGDVKQRDVTVVDLLKERLENFMDEKVDDSGRKASGYGEKTTRMNYIINSIMDHNMKFSIDKAVREVKEQLKKYVDETLRTQIGDEIAKAIGLEQILDKAVGVKK